VAAAIPPPEAARAFDAYVRVNESRVDAITQDKDGFLWADTAERRGRLRQASVICEPRDGKGDRKVPGGLIHHWVGASFIPGARVGEMLALLQDYDNHKNTYQPEVIDSRTLEHSGNDYKVRLRLLKRKVVTVVLDTDYQIQYRPLNGRDWQSRSYSTRIVEIANAGGPRERELTPEQSHGYMWRLNSYWLLRERDGGVYVECEAVSLSRGVPAALAWLIDPIIRSLPKDALAATLRATRTQGMKTVAARQAGAAAVPR
jgi:hypothetical protein